LLSLQYTLVGQFVRALVLASAAASRLDIGAADVSLRRNSLAKSF
jgi:hypothetical protein